MFLCSDSIFLHETNCNGYIFIAFILKQEKMKEYYVVSAMNRHERWWVVYGDMQNSIVCRMYSFYECDIDIIQWSKKTRI